MTQLPRIALGTVQAEADLQCALWAVMNVLERSGVQVQSFSSQSRCDSRDVAQAITGQGQRHLDSWLMPPRLCSELFYHSSRRADIGLVEGRFDADRMFPAGGGRLDTLCSWLDLPRIAVVDVRQLATCRLPGIPREVEGMILDNVASLPELCRMRTALEALYGAPVLGTLEQLEPLRAAASNLPRAGKPPRELCDALGNSLASNFRLDSFLEIASRRGFQYGEDLLERGGGGVFHTGRYEGGLNVAVAHDDAFRNYFPDSFDVLEAQGATVNMFSPLRSESLPAGTDVVYLGDGDVEGHVGELSSNVCLKEALWSHVLCGGRVYAEGAGLAYLCREVVMPDGSHWPMPGLLAALARRHPRPAPETAVEVRTSRSSWLFPANESVRGYLSSRWIIHPDGRLVPLVSEAEHSHDLVGNRQVVGSRLHLNFAARPDCVKRFFRPCRHGCLKAVL